MVISANDDMHQLKMADGLFFYVKMDLEMQTVR